MSAMAGATIIEMPDAARYRQAVNDRLDATMAVVAAWQAVHEFNEARTRRPFEFNERSHLAALRNAALECEGVYERALAREREAGDRVLKVVLHG